MVTDSENFENVEVTRNLIYLDISEKFNEINFDYHYLLNMVILRGKRSIK